MRHLLVAILGLLIGTALGGAVLFYNPFTTTAADAPSRDDLMLRYSLPDQVLGLAIGVAWRNIAGLPPRTELGLAFAQRTVLRGAIVLLGFQITVADIWC